MDLRIRPRDLQTLRDAVVPEDTQERRDAYSSGNFTQAAYSTRWRTRFHADGGQCSSVMADSVPR